MARNRVIYQSEAVYVGPTPAISGFLADKTMLVPTGYLGHTNGDGGDFFRPLGGGTVGAESNQIKQLHRIQTCNYAFNIARTDINQFGELAAIDRVVMDTPTVSMDCSYILATMENEKNRGMVIDGSTSCISGLLSKNSDEKNYFIKTVGEGRDAVGDVKTSVVGSADETQTIATIGIGNGFLTSYTTECSVGNFPTVSVNVEGLNMTFAQGVSGGSPAIVPESGVRLESYKYILPVATGSPDTGILATSALRPGDITFSFKKSDAEGQTLVSALDGVAENSYDAPGSQLGDMAARAHA